MARCKHKWKIIQEIKVYSHFDRTLPYKFILLLCCEECGKLKKVRLNANG